MSVRVENNTLVLPEGVVIQMHHSGLACKGHGNLPRDWCEHINRVLDEGADAQLIHKGSVLTVPVFPAMDVFVEVHIDEGDAYGKSAPMQMLFTPEIGRPYTIGLGFWNPGEGMRSIRTVILDYMKSNLHPDDSLTGLGVIHTGCPASVHGVRESRLILEKCTSSAPWRLLCLWNMVMEKACTPCMELSGTPDNSNFGIDDSVIANRKF